jgi:hypothetical protein
VKRAECSLRETRLTFAESPSGPRGCQDARMCLGPRLGQSKIVMTSAPPGMGVAPFLLESPPPRGVPTFGECP